MRNLLSTLLVAIATVFFLVSCEPEPDPVPQVIKVEKVTIDPSSVTLNVGETTTLTASVSPSNATDKTVSWLSTNTSVVTVSNGTVTAVGEGRAEITATAGGKTGSCSIQVENKIVDVTNLTLDPPELTLYTGQSITLNATVTPSDATYNTVQWWSSNENMITVSDDGVVTALAPGITTIVASAGTITVRCNVTVIDSREPSIKTALLELYDAMDGDNWKIDTYYGSSKWDLQSPLKDWCYVEWKEQTGELKLHFWDSKYVEPIGLKGEFPDCFDEWTWLTGLQISNEPGITGTLPPSFNKLKNLKELRLFYTSMTSLSDVFNGIPLEIVDIIGNHQMTGPLPQSLGSSPSLKLLDIESNHFTGTVPDSWAQLGERLRMRLEPYLDRQVPNSFATAPKAGYLINMYMNLSQHFDPEVIVAPVEVGDYDIPAFWPESGMEDVVTGKSIPYQEIVSQNKVTVLLSWGTWCSFSKEMMPVLKQMYEKYHKDGLEIIAAINPDIDESNHTNKLKDAILERGYDQWYNVNLHDLGSIGMEIWTAGGTPSSVLVDNKGITMSGSAKNISDPSRNRFGYVASGTLISRLEDIFGPLEDGGEYSSTDYSQDGKYFTIQKSTKGKGINLVIMGDAYTDKDIESGLYEQMMRKSAEEFFSIEPYRTFKDRFNVYAVKVVSKNGKTGEGYQTALKASAGSGAFGGGNADIVYQYATKVPGVTNKNLTVCVIVNSIYHGGITNLSESQQSGIGYYSSMSNDPEAFGSTLRHEVGGHAFGFLGDEYSNNNGSLTQEQINDYNRVYEQYGWYSNVDFTNDPDKVKWADFLKDSRYKDEVGIYEGGLNVTTGVYRPSVNSMMRFNDDYFNAPSRWAIYQRIMKLSGETATFSKFLEYDAVNR